MSIQPLASRTRDAIARSRLYVCVVTPAWLRHPDACGPLAYAVSLGKPIRVLLAPGVRLPEEAFAGITDLAVARMQGPQADRAQITAWLESLREGDPR